jgi:hypothetical protein
MKPLGDRRGPIRFEVVGKLLGTLETVETGRIINISATGALVEMPGPVAVGSVHAIYLNLDGQPQRVTVRVRRMAPPMTHDRYAVGVEFLSPSRSFTESLGGLIAGRSGRMTDSIG